MLAKRYELNIRREMGKKWIRNFERLRDMGKDKNQFKCKKMVGAPGVKLTKLFSSH